MYEIVTLIGEEFKWLFAVGRVKNKGQTEVCPLTLSSFIRKFVIDKNTEGKKRLLGKQDICK